jgi:hypothetical protein
MLEEFQPRRMPGNGHGGFMVIWRFVYRFVGILWMILGALILIVAIGYLIAVLAMSQYMNVLLSPAVQDLLEPLVSGIKPGVQQSAGLMFAIFCIVFGFGFTSLRGWSRTLGIAFHFVTGLVIAVLSIVLYYRIIMPDLVTAAAPVSRPILVIVTGWIIAAGSIGLGFQLSTHPAIEAFSGYIPTPPAMPPVSCPTCGGSLDLEKGFCPTCDADNPPLAPTHAKLVELQSGREYPVSTRRPVRIGRDTPGLEILLEDNSISGEHAFIEYVDGHFYLHTLKDANGTFLNGSDKPICDAEIRTDDLITFGRAQFRFIAE